MTIIKTIPNIILSGVLLFAISCGDSQMESGNIAELRMKKDSLRKAKNDIALQINKIEDQLKLMDTSGNHNVPLVVVEKVDQSTFRHYVQVQGVVETDQNAAINPEVSAKINLINTKEGDHVKKGTILVQLDSRVIKNSIAEVKTQLELANTIYEKQKSLWDQKVGSEVQ